MTSLDLLIIRRLVECVLVLYSKFGGSLGKKTWDRDVFVHVEIPID